MKTICEKPLLSDVTDWQAFSKYHKFLDETCDRPTNLRDMQSEDMEFYKSVYEDFAAESDKNRKLIQKQRDILNKQMLARSDSSEIRIVLKL